MVARGEGSDTWVKLCVILLIQPPGPSAGRRVNKQTNQVLGNMLRTYELEEKELNLKDPFSSFLSAAAYAIRSTYHTTLEATPAELVFGRNMFLPEQFKA